MGRKRSNGEGTIRQRPDGRWEGRYTAGRDPGTGKQIQKSVYGKTKQEVSQKLQRIGVEQDDGTYREPSKLTVSAWLNIWIEEYTGHLKGRTRIEYSKHVKNQLIPAFGAVKLSALTPHEIQSFYNRLLSGDSGPALSPKTIKNIHGILHKALSQAVEVGYLRFNPSDPCKLPRIEKAKINPLEEEQVSIFLNTIHGHRYERFYLVDLFTGMRQGELLGLTWDCIDFNKGTIYLYRQLQLVDGKYQFTTLKNKKTRTIAAAPSVMRVLREQKKAQAEWRLKAGAAWNDGNFVFSDEIGRHLARQTVYKNFKRILESMDMPDVRFHDLRHSFAVISLQSGDDVKTVQENLGHHTAAFTLDVYGHVTEKMRKDSASRMESFINEVSQKR